MEVNLSFLLCFTLYLRVIFQVQVPGGLYLEGRFNGGFFFVTGFGGVYLEGLIHGGAYFLGLVQWGRIFEEGRLFSIVGLKGRSNEKKSLRHVNMVAEFIHLNGPWSCRYGRKNAKIDMHNFPVRGHSHFLNSSPGVSSKLLRLSKH